MGMAVAAMEWRDRVEECRRSEDAADADDYASAHGLAQHPGFGNVPNL